MSCYGTLVAFLSKHVRVHTVGLPKEMDLVGLALYVVEHSESPIGGTCQVTFAQLYTVSFRDL